MKYLGLIKWFDADKGYGIIANPELGEVFIHQSNILLKPEKILKATAFFFETKSEKNKLSAIKAQPPASNEDFELIMAYLVKEPSIPIEVTITGESKWGNKYKRKEIKNYSLFGCALTQLMRSKKASEVYQLFISHFNTIPQENVDYILKYYSKSIAHIKNLKVEMDAELKLEYESTLKEENSDKPLTTIIRKYDRIYLKPESDFILQKVLVHYLKESSNEIRFTVWKKEMVETEDLRVNHYGKGEYEALAFSFPEEI